MAYKGYIPTKEHREKIRLSKLGKKRSPETIAKMKAGLKGRSVWNKGLKGFRAGEKRPYMSILMKGNKYAWRHGNLSDVHEGVAYDKWRLEVCKRDNNQCRFRNQDCEGRLEAHHILPWRDYKELRYNVDNGIILCVYHHPRQRKEEERLIPIFQELVRLN